MKGFDFSRTITNNSFKSDIIRDLNFQELLEGISGHSKDMSIHYKCCSLNDAHLNVQLLPCSKKVCIITAKYYGMS